MQRRPAHGEASLAGRKVSFRGQPGTEKAHAANGPGLGHRHGNSQPFHCCDCIRHQRFAAGLVNWRLGAIGYHRPESLLAGGDRHCQPGWSATNDKDICRIH
jgi:hypothetical protein